MTQSELIILAKRTATQHGLDPVLGNKWPRALRPTRNKPVVFMPSICDSRAHGGWIESGFPAGYDQVHSFTVKYNEAIVSLIAVLFRPCSPVTILGRVVGVVVSTFYAVKPRGAWAHVFQKRLKTIPTIADFNSTPSVVGKACAFWIQTALSHLIPCRTLRGSFSDS